MTRSEQALIDAILRSDFESFLRRCLISLAQELRAMGQWRVKPVPVNRDKVTRLFVQAAKFEAGLVHFPKNAWYLQDLLAELLAFPNGRHDDQVDSISQALAYRFSGYTLDNL